MPKRDNLRFTNPIQFITSILAEERSEGGQARPPRVRMIGTHKSRQNAGARPSLEQVEAWLESPIERTSATSREDLYDPEAPKSLTEFFAEYLRAIHEGRVKTVPAAECREERLRQMETLRNCGPYHVSVEVEP